MADECQIPEDNGLSVQQAHTPNFTTMIVWFAAGVLVTIALSLVAAHAPPRIRLIGLFPIAFGVLIGWSLVRLTSLLEARPSRRTMVIFAVLLSLGGWVGTTWETWRLDEAQSTKSATEALAARMMKEFDQQAKSTGLEASPHTALGSFESYLSRRIRQLGDWPRPWPFCFWLGESIAAAVAGGVVSGRRNQAAAAGSDTERDVLK